MEERAILKKNGYYLHSFSGYKGGYKETNASLIFLTLQIHIHHGTDSLSFIHHINIISNADSCVEECKSLSEVSPGVRSISSHRNSGHSQNNKKFTSLQPFDDMTMSIYS